MSHFTHKQSQTKVCTKCGETKPLDEFSRDRRRADGRGSHCKACVAETKRAWEDANRERGAERKRAWAKANPEKRAEHLERYNAKHPERRAARKAVSQAVRYGKMPPARDLPCTSCDEPAQEYHHYLGYSPEHWLDVIAVCITCHVKLDKE